MGDFFGYKDTQSKNLGAITFKPLNEVLQNYNYREFIQRCVFSIFQTHETPDTTNTNLVIRSIFPIYSKRQQWCDPRCYNVSACCDSLTYKYLQISRISDVFNSEIKRLTTNVNSNYEVHPESVKGGHGVYKNRYRNITELWDGKWKTGRFADKIDITNTDYGGDDEASKLEGLKRHGGWAKYLTSNDEDYKQSIDSSTELASTDFNLNRFNEPANRLDTSANLFCRYIHSLSKTLGSNDSWFNGKEWENSKQTFYPFFDENEPRILNKIGGGVDESEYSEDTYDSGLADQPYVPPDNNDYWVIHKPEFCKKKNGQNRNLDEIVEGDFLDSETSNDDYDEVGTDLTATTYNHIKKGRYKASGVTHTIQPSYYKDMANGSGTTEEIHLKCLGYSLNRTCEFTIISTDLTPGINPGVTLIDTILNKTLTVSS